MKLESIKLMNWKQHSYKYIEFDDKATVIYGSNEKGKSTIFEALHRGLFDSYKSASKGVRKIQPLNAIGRVSSSVGITFLVGDEKYLLEKTFNHNAGSTLYRLGDEKIFLGEDKYADQFVLDLLEAEMQKGKSKGQSNWGAFYWLWTSQDKRELPKDGDVGALKLDQVEGNVMMTPKLDKVRQGFEKRYKIFYTNTGQQYTHSPIVETKEKLEPLISERDGLTLRLSAVEIHQQDLNSRLEELPRFIEGLEHSKEEHKIAIEDSRDYIKIKADQETSEAKIKEIHGALNEANDALSRLKAAASRIEGFRSDEGKLRDKLIQAEVKGQRIEDNLNKFTQRIDRNSDKLGKIDELLADARAQYTITKNKKDQEQVIAKINEIEEIENKINELQSGSRELLVSEVELLKLEQDDITLKIKKQTLEDAGLKIERIAGSKGSLEVNLDGNKLGNDTGTATSEVIVSHNEFGEVIIQADLEKAQDIKRELELLTRRIKDTIDSNRVNSIPELRIIFSENEKINFEVSTLSAKRSGIDSKSLDLLRSELMITKEKADGYLGLERSEYVVKNNPLDENLGSLLVKREKERRDTESILSELREERDKIREEREVSRAKTTELNVTRDAIILQTRDMEKTQQELFQRFGSEKMQSEKIIAETERLNAQLEKKAELERQFEEYKEGPLATIQRLENSMANQEGIIQNHRAAIEQLRGKIIENSLDGTYSRLSKIESRIESLKERQKTENIMADAIKLLKKVLEARYKGNIEEATKPVKLDAAEYLAYVTGNLHEEVELNDKLFPVRLGERGLSELALDYEDGSSGLREAIGLCVRIAIAKNLCSFDSQCLILDDPFVHVSADRSMRIIELINRIVDETGLQVLILTHRPSEFTGLTGKMIDIQS